MQVYRSTAVCTAVFLTSASTGVGRRQCLFQDGWATIFRMLNAGDEVILGTLLFVMWVIYDVVITKGIPVIGRLNLFRRPLPPPPTWNMLPACCPSLSLTVLRSWLVSREWSGVTVCMMLCLGCRAQWRNADVALEVLAMSMKGR